MPVPVSICDNIAENYSVTEVLGILILILLVQVLMYLTYYVAILPPQKPHHL